MNKCKRIIYVTIGLIALILGAIGTIIPVLPTTPFLLLTSFCFIRGSEKFNIYFKETKIYKNHLESFINEKTMTLKQQVIILLLVTFIMAFPLIILDSIVIKVILILVLLCKYYYFIFKIKTKKSESKLTK